MLKSKIVRYLLVTAVFFVFFSIAVIAIIITRGGQLTDDGLVLESGVIRVQTDPDNIAAKYYLDDKEVQPTEKRINGILEGVYKLKIESPGYVTWEKEVKVTSGIVLDVFAKLYPSNFILAQLSSTNIDRAFFSANGEFVYYVVKDSEFGSDKGIWKLRLVASQFLFGTSTNTPQKLADLSPQISAAIESGSYDLLPSPDNNRLLFRDTKSNNNLLINANSFNELPLPDVNETLSFVPEQLTWFNGSNSIIVKDGPLLLEHNLTNNINTVIKYSKTEELVYSVSNPAVYVYNPATAELLKYANQILEPVITVNLTLPANITELHTPLNNSRFLIFKADTLLYYLDLEKSLLKQIGTGIKFYEFAQDGRSALFTRDKQLLTYTVKEILATNTVETKLNETSFTLESQADVVHFVPQSTHILHYANGEKHLITATEKDGANPIVILNSTGIKNADFSFVSDGSRFVVLLKDEIEATQVPSRANLYSIDLEGPVK